MTSKVIDEATVVHGSQIPENNIQVHVNIHQDPAVAQDIPYDVVEKYFKENHAVEQSDVLSKIINGLEVFTPSEDKQISLKEEAPAPGVIHEASLHVQKFEESVSRTGEVPKRSYASINAAPMSVSRTPTKVVEPKRQEDQGTHVPLPTSLPEKSDSRANVAVIGNDQENERAPGPSTYLKGLPLDETPALLENEFQKFG